MSIPESLEKAIENEIARFDWQQIMEARKELTERYRNRTRNSNFMTNDIHRCAYIATRMPATYCVVRRVLEEVRIRCPEAEIRSLLDLGAGPGTVMWAANAIYPSLETITVVEVDENLALLGRRLALTGGPENLKYADWKNVNLERIESLPRHDLVTLSYSIGELSEEKMYPLLDACWQATGKYLVIVEPGTPEGFARIRTARQYLLNAHAFMIAPCPHAVACPMPKGDWCHFSERVDRSSAHRRLKEGTLGYEDEKYSYIAAGKTPVALPPARIVRHPEKKSGHVNLTLCTREGLKQETVSKRTKESYKAARKAEWGSVFLG